MYKKGMNPRLLVVVIDIAFLAMPFALATALVAFFVCKTQRVRVAPALAVVIVGTIFPFFELVYALYLTWSSPHLIGDMVNSGPMLAFCSVPIWLLCLLTSRLVITVRAKGKPPNTLLGDLAADRLRD